MDNNFHTLLKNEKHKQHKTTSFANAGRVTLRELPTLGHVQNHIST